MRFGNPYWSKIDRVNMLQRWIIVHSILYYEMDASFVPDHVYDANARQLVDEMSSMTLGEKKKSRLWYAFKDYDGSTGFHLYSRLTTQDKDLLMNDAKFALRMLKKYGKLTPPRYV